MMAVDSAESQLFNESKEDYLGDYKEGPYLNKWIVSNMELNPGVEISFLCPKSSSFQIRISGSNFGEVVRSYDPN